MTTIKTRRFGTATLQPVSNDPQSFVVVSESGRALGCVSGNNLVGWTAVVYPGPRDRSQHVTAREAAIVVMATI